MEVADRISAALREIFFLNTLSMPPQTSAEMTAFEVGQRVQDYIRQAIPLFEPMEVEYNGALCEVSFEVLMRNGAFGRIEDIPTEIQGQEITWGFESPISESIERGKGQKFLESKALMAEAIAVDPSSVHVVDFRTALRDALAGIGAPMAWQRSPEETEETINAEKQAAEAQQLLEGMDKGADVVQKLGAAGQNFAA
jgi:hypothetical protein